MKLSIQTEYIPIPKKREVQNSRQQATAPEGNSEVKARVYLTLTEKRYKIN
ncbi:hypothetical protein [Okeania sp. SIO2B3]|uniref:hypothetical protein n=1 Tax=Okeania sp. SIO2B3 TaxID=2607784 RepID=UPI0013C05DF0|nr:hypothetical protein [Okeania sp. SIO2B3]NET46608.1 hypothetical protein [Okeania sp. SIO2B3]